MKASSPPKQRKLGQTVKKPVYVFFHTSFQEYFAAKAIDDWHFFLNHVRNHPVQLLQSNHLDDYTCIQVASSLGKIDPGNENAIAAFVQLLLSTNVPNNLFPSLL